LLSGFIEGKDYGGGKERRDIRNRESRGDAESAWADFVIILGVVCLVAALASDHMRVWRDLWAAATYPNGQAPRTPRRRMRKAVSVP